MSRVAAALAALAALVAGCVRDHDPGQIQTAAEGCITCHLHDYQATTAPNHGAEAERYPRTCRDCHRETAWQPALEGPHGGRFRRGGDHDGIACLDCHAPERGPSAGGVNTTCALCHTHRQGAVDGEHDDVRGYQWQPDRPSFCVDCHPTGGED